jgi:phospholipid transport system substrate-binding protein
MNRILRSAHTLLLILAVPALAQALAPDALLRTLTDEVLAIVRQDKRIQSGDPKATAALVETRLVPHFDFRRATRIAMGKAWREATPRQQERLTEEFRELLVRTYSGALSGYRNQSIEFLPLRAGSGDEEVTVRSRVRQPGAEAVLIEYDMARDGGAWKVFDVRVAGISLVATYRTSFAEEVRNRGIDGLIAALEAKNGS